MKIIRKSALPVILLLCAVVFAGCDTYHYGVKQTRHQSKVNKEKTMYVHKSTYLGIREFGKSHRSKPAAMYKQTKYIK